MKKKSGYRQAAAFLLAAVLGVTGVQTIWAGAMSKAKDEKARAEEQLDSANDRIEAIEQRQAQLQGEIDEKDAELVNLLVNMGILEDELADKSQQLEQVTVELEEAQESEKQQYASMKKRIQFMYERGDSAMVEAILGSENMADFLNRVEYVSDIYTYDRNLLTQYQRTIKQVAELKSTVETEKAEMEAMQEEYALQQASLENILAEKRSEMGSYDNQLASARQAAAAYRQTIAEQNEIIKEEERKAKEAEEKAKAEAAAKAAAAADNNNSNTDNSNSNSNSNTGNSNNTGSSDSTTGNGGNTGSSDTAAGNGGNTGSSDSTTGNGSDTGSNDTAAGNGNNTGSNDSSTDNGNNNGSGNSNTGNSNNTGNTGSGGGDPSYSTNVSGSEVVNYACQFIGNPYVWGGTSLINGADCSGFVMSVFAKFGISLPHSSAALQSCGKAVSYANAKPGDLICYSGHVAIYMGGGQIVHAQSAAVGITTSSATYRTIVCVRRVL